MIQTWPHRLATERRLLAALFLWPTRVDLEPHHFLSPEHGVLFNAIQESGNALLDENQALSAMNVILERDELADMFNRLHGIDNYIIEELIPVEVTPHAVPDLVEMIRECPRCGR